MSNRMNYINKFLAKRGERYIENKGEGFDVTSYVEKYLAKKEIRG